MARTPPFHKRSYRIRRAWRRSRLRTLIRPLLLGALLIAGWYVTRPLVAPEWNAVPADAAAFGVCGERGRPHACVTDGDTVTLGYGPAARRLRLRGFDAPEIAGACPAESARAAEAQAALLAWLNAGPFEWDGGDDPPRDRYGRELRSARRGEVLLADHMVERGLANRDDAHFMATDWCA